MSLCHRCKKRKYSPAIASNALSVNTVQDWTLRCVKLLKYLSAHNINCRQSISISWSCTLTLIISTPLCSVHAFFVIIFALVKTTLRWGGAGCGVKYVQLLHCTIKNDSFHTVTTNVADDCTLLFPSRYNNDGSSALPYGME